MISFVRRRSGQATGVKAAVPPTDNIAMSGNAYVSQESVPPSAPGRHMSTQPYSPLDTVVKLDVVFILCVWAVSVGVNMAVQ